MSLDWSNERYLRLYRPSVDHRTLCWQARVIWPLIMQEADGAGVIGARRGVAAIAKAIDVPLEVVEPGVADLLADGCLQEIPGGYVIRNYVAAQTATMSDSSRKARQRDVDRAVEALAAAAGQEKKASAQIGHAASREVTDGHDGSRSVTPSRAEPSRNQESLSPARATHGPDAAPVAPQPEPIGPLIEHAIAGLNNARSAIDPDHEPIHPMRAASASAAGLRARLGEVVPPSDRRRKLDAAISVLAARAKAAGVVDDLTLGELGGARSWYRLLDGSVKGAARSGAGPPPRASPRPTSRGQHNPDTSTPFPDGEQPI